MAGSVRLDSPDKNEDTTKEGTGWYIGDGYILTAGHVIFEFNERDDPDSRAIIKISSIVVHDDLNYNRAYRAAALTPPDPHSVTSEELEIQAGSRAIDSVVVSGSSTVDDDDAGLVVYLDRTDMIGTNAGLKAATTIARDGINSSKSSGEITSFRNVGLVYSHAAVPGDSGGALLLKFDGKQFVLGSIHSTNQSTQSYESYLSLIIFSAAAARSTTWLPVAVARRVE